MDLDSLHAVLKLNHDRKNNTAGSKQFGVHIAKHSSTAAHLFETLQMQLLKIMVT